LLLISKRPIQKYDFLPALPIQLKSLHRYAGISEIILNQKNQQLKAPHTTMQESAKSYKSIKSAVINQRNHTNQ
jgi:hypothetical protein